MASGSVISVQWSISWSGERLVLVVGAKLEAEERLVVVLGRAALREVEEGGGARAGASRDEGNGSADEREDATNGL